MPDIRQDLAKTAEKVATMAMEVAYVAIGVGILAFNRAQVRRQGLADAAERANLDGSIVEARNEVAKRLKDFDDSVGQLIKTFDATLDPVWERLPEPAQAVVQQAKGARDQVRSRITTLPPDQASRSRQ
jgi:hypothetical protein